MRVIFRPSKLSDEVAILNIEPTIPHKLKSFLSFRPTDGAQYTVYAYDRYEDEKVGLNRWQRVSTSHSSKQALLRAQVLFQSRRYQKIEVKKKVHDSKTGMNIDTVYRVYQENKRRNYFLAATIVMGLVIGASLTYLQIM